MIRVEDRVDAPVERYSAEIGDSGFRVRRCDPLPSWHEAIAYRESDGRLYVPDVLGTAPLFTVGDEESACVSSDDRFRLGTRSSIATPNESSSVTERISLRERRWHSPMPSQNRDGGSREGFSKAVACSCALIGAVMN